jgi:hypothetical protein
MVAIQKTLENKGCRYSIYLRFSREILFSGFSFYTRAYFVSFATTINLQSLGSFCRESFIP